MGTYNIPNVNRDFIILTKFHKNHSEMAKFVITCNVELAGAMEILILLCEDNLFEIN